MSDYVVTLIGGPCDGQSKRITATTLAAGQLTCQGTLYVRSNAFTSQENIVFATSAAIAKQTQGPSPKRAMQAWGRWMHVLAHQGPRSHRRTLAVAHRARNIARHR